MNETQTPVTNQEEPKQRELTQEEMYTLQQQQTMQIFQSLVPDFEYWVDHLSNKQLRRVLKTLVKFPFVADKLRLPSDEEKETFRLGERIIHAKMVLYAREELKATISTLDKMEENKENKENAPESKEESKVS